MMFELEMDVITMARELRGGGGWEMGDGVCRLPFTPSGLWVTTGLVCNLHLPCHPPPTHARLPAVPAIWPPLSQFHSPPFTFATRLPKINQSQHAPSIGDSYSNPEVALAFPADALCPYPTSGPNFNIDLNPLICQAVATNTPLGPDVIGDLERSH
ncbi:hypothetical protein CC85DRAFT_115087 [Cutaneotrichosporon oleaginosum]|uniref:Uncharacterized protein n=1 Tax=Cutaneotrichosporon oleaginosum TaxID=879819 RepID=A0A0J0XXB6_9TREE|nr:uncharacterized protein CC85DRAFT_115087 [Cutaneotrichosporon oleaginosum]KLT45701.1 hypothetical protein CC85DRAFT_115087 [Cutaneotrichosporon oleaginosum]TXT06197.1 hypothetical protein COLE_05528 [Cutaneotrichosporon oleaginosum]